MNKDKIEKILKIYNINGLVSSVKQLQSFANEVYFVNVSNLSFILKKHLVSNKKDLLERLTIIQELKNNGINIPSILVNSKNEYITAFGDGIYELDEYIDHKSLNYPEYNITLQELTQAGIELAKIHNTSKLQAFLKSIDFTNINNKVVKLIDEFDTLYESDASINEKTQRKAEVIYKFLENTKEGRNELLKNSLLYNVSNSDYVLIHGDYSLTNLLPSKKDGKLYITDWDGMKYAPRMFEVQRAIGLLCSNGKCNANLDEYNVDRVKAFLSGYKQNYTFTSRDIDILGAVANYCFYIYWLEFSLSQTINGDYRILDIFPNKLEDAMFWKTNVEKYITFLKSEVIMDV